jgi:hypothetical protein
VEPFCGHRFAEDIVLNAQPGILLRRGDLGLRRSGRPTQGTIRSRREAWMLTAIAAVILTILATLTMGFFEPHILGGAFDFDVWVLGIVAILTCYAAWSLVGRVEPFLLPVWFAANLFVQVVVNVWFFGRTSSETYSWARVRDDLVWMEVLLAYGTSMCCVLIGFRAGLGRRVAASGAVTMKQAIDQKRATAVVVVGTLPTLLFRAADFAGTANTAWNNYLYVAGFLANVALLSFIITWLLKPSRWVFAVCCGGILAQMSSLVYAGTKTFAFVLIWIAICWFYARRRVPIRVIGGGVLAVILLVPVVNGFRSRLLSNSGASVERSTKLRSAMGTVLGQGLGESAGQTLDTMTSRQIGVFQYSAIILDSHPNPQPFVAGEMARLFADSLVPRIIWPEKPVEHPDLYMLGRRYQGWFGESSFATPGIVADAYRVGGWPFLAVFSFLLGLAGAGLYRFGPLRGHVAGTALYILAVTTVLTYDRGVFDLVMAMLQAVVPGILVAYWIRARSGHPEPAPPAGGRIAERGLSARYLYGKGRPA